MLATTKKRIALLCCIVVIIWLLFHYTLGNRSMLSSIETLTRTPGTPILVSVFYEALCPDSKHFITKQLLPTYKAFPSMVEIILIPYGKATITKSDPDKYQGCVRYCNLLQNNDLFGSLGSDGSLQFDCQHGPLECQANIYHACALEIITNPQMRLDMVSCMIKDNRLPKDALYRCARDFNLETTDLIQKCHDTEHGSELLKLNGEVTHALRPSVSFIPTITIDGSQGNQAAILKNLMTEVCKVASGDNLVNGICTNN